MILERTDYFAVKCTAQFLILINNGVRIQIHEFKYLGVIVNKLVLASRKLNDLYKE